METYVVRQPRDDAVGMLAAIKGHPGVQIEIHEGQDVCDEDFNWYVLDGCNKQVQGDSEGSLAHEGAKIHNKTGGGGQSEEIGILPGEKGEIDPVSKKAFQKHSN